MFGTSVLSSLFFFPSGDFAFKAFALSASSSLLGVMHKQECLGGMLYWIRFLELQFHPRRLPPSFLPPLFFLWADSFLGVFVLIFSRSLLGANLARAVVGMDGADRCSCF